MGPTPVLPFSLDEISVGTTCVVVGGGTAASALGLIWSSLHCVSLFNMGNIL